MTDSNTNLPSPSSRKRTRVNYTTNNEKKTMQIREPAATPINNNEHQDSTVLGNINKDELVRLMLQSLIDLGYT